MKKVEILKKVNGQPIQIINVDGNKFVPIRPICDALGIDVSRQMQKIREDEILSPTIGVKPMVGADGKQREMVCLPLEFVFGWLFTINPKNVNEDARSLVVRYKFACYEVLYMYFAKRVLFLEEKGKRIEEQLRRYDAVRNNFRDVKRMLAQEKATLDILRKMELEDWEREHAQLSIQFE